MSDLRFPLIVTAAGAVLLTGCSFGADGGPEFELKISEETAVGGTGETDGSGGDAVDLSLFYVSITSSADGIYGPTGDLAEDGTVSGPISDTLRTDNAICSGTPDLVAIESVDPASGIELTVSVHGDGTGAVDIIQPDNPDHAGWTSAPSEEDQSGTWSYTNEQATLTDITMSTVALDGWASMSGNITCTEDTVG